MPIRVLVVDDSAVVRQVLSKGLAQDPDIEVVGVASDPYIARDLIVQKKPHVMTLDVEMPRMDGIEFLRKLMPQAPMPVIMVSSLTQSGASATLEALEAGALDYVTKPGSQFGGGGQLENVIAELIAKVKVASRARIKKPQVTLRKATSLGNRVLKGTTDKIVALGASTGGTEALKEVISGFPPDMPGTVVVQHMPGKFTAMYAERLNTQCAVEVKEAKDGDRIIPGRVLIAPGEYQMSVVRKGGQYHVQCKQGERVSGHCPSVDVLFRSVAQDVGVNAYGVILTGMGADGADGLLKMRMAGARTLGQDEESCVVYGMPKVAYERGGVERQLPLSVITRELISLLKKAASAA